MVSKIPKPNDPNLIVGFDTSDDGSVYRLTDEIAIINTLDFFPPMVDDPYLFGKIAAANSLSDIYAMGGEVKTALNIVCFPEEEDAEILGEILRGGAEKVLEAGGVLCGGHSINDKETKYGLSVTGIVHPDKILYNNRCEIGDKIILTKPLGVGMICAAYKAGAASNESYAEAIKSMQHLNRYAIDIAKTYRVHSCTDVTGFGFLGHLNEMVSERYSIEVDSSKIPYIKEAWTLAEQFLITGGGIKNRRFLKELVDFGSVPYPMQEILLDPQTSGGLLISVHADDASDLVYALSTQELGCALVGEVVEAKQHNVIVR